MTMEASTHPQVTGGPNEQAPLIKYNQHYIIE